MLNRNFHFQIIGLVVLPVRCKWTILFKHDATTERFDLGCIQSIATLLCYAHHEYDTRPNERNFKK